jgi:hypothetical protein
MAKHEQLCQLAAISVTGPCLGDNFIFIGPRPAGETHEINPRLLNMLKGVVFRGDGTENPYEHVQQFNEICETFKLCTFSHEEMKLKLFSYTLANDTKAWLHD